MITSVAHDYSGGMYVFIGLFFILRVIQRLYFVCRGHTHYFTYSPRKELEKLLKKKNIVVSNHVIQSTNDGVYLSYRRMGTGPKRILIANGVGTDFFMWLPMLRFVLSFNPAFFDKCTVIVQSYRGLTFPEPLYSGDTADESSNEDSPSSTVQRTTNVAAALRTRKQAISSPQSTGRSESSTKREYIRVTVDNCVDDILDMMHHAGELESCYLTIAASSNCASLFFEIDFFIL